MARGRVKKKVEWPCGSCHKNCDSYCVYCELCEKWYHNTCQDIDKKTLIQLGDISGGFICVTCRCDDTCQFDFMMGMARLKKASQSGIETLKSVVRREILLLGNIRMTDIPRKERLQQLDNVGTRLLNRYTCEYSTKAASVSADGDCLFNAISTHLVGDESLSLELRYRTCLEMLHSKQKLLSHKERSSFHLLSPDYDESCRSCAKFGDSFSSVWTIMALGNVISIPIQTIYPVVNGRKDLAVIKFNTVFEPDCAASTLQPLKIMWSNINYPTAGKIWTPNHFVPIVSSDLIKTSTEHPPMDSFPGLPVNSSTPESKRQISPNNTEEFLTPVKQRLSNLSSPTSSEKLSFCSDNRYHVLSDESDMDVPGTCQFEGKISISPIKPSKRLRQHSPSPSGAPFNTTVSSNESFKEDNPDIHQPILESQQKNFTDRDALKNSQNSGKFMSVESVFNVLKTVNQPANSIPLGPKNDVYVVVDNSRNRNKTRSEFPDDCGTWCSSNGTTANQLYAISADNKLTTIHKKNGKYHTKKMVNGKTVFLLCDPQPDRLLTIHRYYTKLKHDEGYKKRITVIIEAPEDLRHLMNNALVEYSGTKSVQNTPHGNCKMDTPYIRTDPEILRSCAAETKLKSATEVCYLAAKDNSVLGPKSARQINDKVFREKKNYNSKPVNNIADEVLTLISQIHTNCNIQKVEMTKNKLPNVILYTKQQMEDMKANCTGDGASILGIDRTFNLGRCFVTAISYKNKKVAHRKTNENPIMLGPVFLHWDGETTTYHFFFSHIRAQLGGAVVTIGTDEERAMTNALHDCFNNANFLLCTKHIKENIHRFLEKSGTSIKDRMDIIKIIFDKDGVIHSQDTIQYELRISDLESYFTKSPKFKVYWERYLELKIKNYVMQPLQTGLVTSPWTNNNSESINNRLKQVADYKQHKLPELVEKLSLVSNIQMLDLRRALHGTGNFVLTGQFKTFELDQASWNGKTTTEREHYFWKFLKKNITPVNKLMKASSCDFRCPMPKNNCGKKPGQRRRAKSEKTRTIKKIV